MTRRSVLTVGIDVSVLRHGLSNGTAVYCFNLARALLSLPEPPVLRLFFGARSSRDAEVALGELTGLGGTLHRAPPPWSWSPDGAWWLPVRPPMGRFFDGLDVFHLGEFHFPRDVGIPAVATVHDLTTLLLPEQHVWLNRALHARRLRWIREHAARIIVVSESTGRDLTRLLEISPERTVRIYEARGHDSGEPPAGQVHEARARHGLGEKPYVLSVGTLEPRKNHERLVRAFSELSPQFDDVHLAIAGGEGWRADGIRQAVEESSAPNRIRLLGPVPGRDLQALYSGARVFALPSLYEGFGLPVLEAMACGTPVLTSDVSSLPEVAGDAALLVDPHSTDAIRDGLERLLGDESLRGRLARRGRERERRFTWRRTAEETMAVYRGVATERPARAGPDAGPRPDGRPEGGPGRERRDG